MNDRKDGMIRRLFGSDTLEQTVDYTNPKWIIDRACAAGCRVEVFPTKENGFEWCAVITLPDGRWTKGCTALSPSDAILNAAEGIFGVDASLSLDET